MDLTINFVWIGPKRLGWLELFMIYSWRLWGCDVVLYAHSGPGNDNHSAESLGLPPNICAVVDLPTLIARDERSNGVGMEDVEQAEPMRRVMASWYANPIRAWGQGGQEQIFNMVDLSKSYVAATRRGIVLDMKIGPSPHLKKYVDKKVFENHFVSYYRAGTIENQCMGSMCPDNSLRREYGKRFVRWAVPSRAEESDKMKAPFDIWFGNITSAHINSCTLGQKSSLKFLDIGMQGRADHVKLYQLANATVEGIAGESFYGPLRIFKKESDQTNKSGGNTSEEERVALRDLAFRELAQASMQDEIDVTAKGMPPVADMLELLDRTK
jgi:hypothetical protein